MNDLNLGCAGAFVGTIALVLFFWFAAMMEASTYSRITGVEVSTWDAMWISLRVDCRGPPT